MRALISFEEIHTDEIIIHFVDEQKISELHEKYFNDPSPTDCITFPIDGLNANPIHHILGEIFISPKAALLYAKKKSINPYFELSLYLVHCFLHLIGYEDIETSDRRKMRRKEKELMKKLKDRDLLLNE